jgi:hypothetical protein
MNKIPCPFCNPPKAPPGGMKIAFLPTDLCPEHLEMSGIPEYERRHPIVDGDRPCNEGCGCVSAEEAFRFLDNSAP